MHENISLLKKPSGTGTLFLQALNTVKVSLVSKKAFLSKLQLALVSYEYYPSYSPSTVNIMSDVSNLHRFPDGESLSVESRKLSPTPT